MSEYKLVPVEPTWEMTNAASENTDVNSFIDINNVYKEMLSASPTTDTVTIGSAEYEAMKADAERIDYIEQKFTGLSDTERYLPFRISWGKGNNKTLRQAIDQARKI